MDMLGVAVATAEAALASWWAGWPQVSACSLQQLLAAAGSNCRNARQFPPKGGCVQESPGQSAPVATPLGSHTCLAPIHMPGCPDAGLELTGVSHSQQQLREREWM